LRKSLHVISKVAIAVPRAYVLFLVPEGEGYALLAVSIRDASNAVLTPSVSSAAGMIVGEICEALQDLVKLSGNGGNVRLQASPS